MAAPAEVLQSDAEGCHAETIAFSLGDLYSDEPPLETYLHLQQLLLRLKC